MRSQVRFQSWAAPAGSPLCADSISTVPGTVKAQRAQNTRTRCQAGEDAACWVNRQGQNRRNECLEVLWEFRGVSHR